ncbi:Rho termination factor N-terminal domain-containing protein [Hominifimenecus sp. rT4P-3]|uniref:Rho termination factor N-terminal domain-containing protein n=1 Tax=Hominifimenecus sp. rT4P-3 TaxID=3242979 RepID=UPI003DA35CEB
MRLIKDNVERIVEDEAQIHNLETAGFKALKADFEAKPDLEKMKVDELKALAKERGIEGTASLTKTELLSVLKDVV